MSKQQYTGQLHEQMQLTAITASSHTSRSTFLISSLIGLLKSLSIAQLYEEVCDAEGCNDIGCSHTRDASAPATIMLLPPQFSVLNESRLPELVSSCPPSCNPAWLCHSCRG